MVDSNTTIGDTADPAADVPDLQGAAVAHIQTDLLCRKCGANLYGREVRPLGQTEVLVTQCPRCQAYASAEEALPYRRVWQQKIGLVIMLAWAGVLCFLASTVVNYQSELIGRTLGRKSRWVGGPLPAGVTMGEGRPMMGRGAPMGEGRPMMGRGVWEFDWSSTSARLPLAIPATVLISLLAVGFGACAVYHWKRRWLILAALAGPALALFMFYWQVVNSPQRQWLAGDALWLALGLTACQVAGGIVGVFVGRPLARVLLGVLLPGKGRQYFAFLWRRDGKIMPGGTGF